MFKSFGFGNLTKTPVVREVGEQYVCNFSLACNHKVKKNGEETYEPTYIDIVYWTKNPSFVESMKVGKKYFFDGLLVQERWEKDGEKFSKYVVKAYDIRALEKSSTDEEDAESTTKSTKSTKSQKSSKSSETEDVPF